MTTPLSASATPVPSPTPEIPPMPTTLWLTCYDHADPVWVPRIDEPFPTTDEIHGTRHRIDIKPPDVAAPSAAWEALRDAAEKLIAVAASEKEWRVGLPRGWWSTGLIAPQELQAVNAALSALPPKGGK